MPAYRIGFATDFNLNNQLIGIGTTNAGYKLTVSGGVLKGDFSIPGVTTLTSYGGFISQKQNISVASSAGIVTTGIGTVGITSFIATNERNFGYVSLIGQYNTVSEDIVVDDGKIFDVFTPTNIGITTIGTQSVYTPESSVVNAGTLRSVSIGTHFSFPNGGIAARPEEPIEGTVRFNDDLNTLEFYNGVEWRQFTVDGSSGRGVFAGQSGPSSSAIVDYINISSTGNGVNFGVLQTNTGGSTCSSSTRGLIAKRVDNTIDYITIASEGNAISFGSLSLPRCSSAGSSSTRGIFFGAYSPSTPAGDNSISYVQISTLGNGVDFGDLTTKVVAPGSCSSPTRVLIGGGLGAPTAISKIDVITTSSTGNAVKFGDLTRFGYALGACASSTRGIFAGGNDGSPTESKVIDYITMSTFGNAINFGDLTVSRSPYANGTSNNVRGVFAGGYRFPSVGSHTNTIDYITIATIGNAIDFGDSTVTGWGHGGLSDSHGGLGGF